MFMDLSSLNWLGVAVATVVYFVFGGLWFSPLAFQRLWNASVGFNRPKGWRAGPKYYIAPLVGCFLISLATAILLQVTGVQTQADAIVLGLIVGIGYVAATVGVLAVAPNIPRPGMYAVVVGLYHIIGVAATAAIIFGVK